MSLSRNKRKKKTKTSSIEQGIHAPSIPPIEEATHVIVHLVLLVHEHHHVGDADLLRRQAVLRVGNDEEDEDVGEKVDQDITVEGVCSYVVCRQMLIQTPVVEFKRGKGEPLCPVTGNTYFRVGTSNARRTDADEEVVRASQQPPLEPNQVSEEMEV
ncbi:hypothetical protein LINGRAHAP2_LOCUS18085 [Linum grandiflorum]